MQADMSRNIPACPVFPVTDYRTTEIRQVNTDLVFSPGFNPDLKKRMPREFLNYLIVGDCKFRIRCFFGSIDFFWALFSLSQLSTVPSLWGGLPSTSA